MKQYLSIASTPVEEDGVSVSRTVDYVDAMKKECNIFKHQLERQFPNPPGNAYFGVKGCPHDFGTYYEVGVYYNDESEEEVDFAFNVENNTPANWDAEALVELGKSGKKYNHMLDVAFEVISPHKDWSDIPTGEILDAMQRRVDYLRAHPADAAEAFGHGDQYEIEEENDNEN